jgi:phosphoglycolate phosphatase
MGIVACIKYALVQLGCHCPSDAELERYIGPPLRGSFGVLIGSDDPIRIDMALRLYRERFSSTGMFENTVYPDILSSLVALRRLGAVLFVATSKPKVFAERIVEHFGLKAYFDAVYGSELDGTRSNKADLIALILEAKSLSPRLTYMVGDHAHDMAGANAHNVRSIGALWGYGSREY